MTAPHPEPDNLNADAVTGNPAPATPELPGAVEIGALFLATAQRLATDEQFRRAIQKLLF